MKRIRPVASNELALLRSDPFPLLVTVAMPVVLAAFVSKAFVGGPTQSIPGLATLFCLMGVPSVGFSFYREHGWGTWNRLRTSPATTAEIMIGKSIPMFGLFLAQQLGLLAMGALLFDLPVRGGFGIAVLVAVPTVATYIALALLLTALCRTVAQLNAFATVGSLVLAGAGGAISALDLLPPWVQKLAPASPVYWTLKGYRVAILGQGSATGPILVLTAFATGLLAATAATFRSYDTKESLPGG
jgi:ABC-2 type transport system permease protein